MSRGYTVVHHWHRSLLLLSLLSPPPPVAPAPKSSYSLLSLLEGEAPGLLFAFRCSRVARTRPKGRSKTNDGLVADASFSFVLFLLPLPKYSSKSTILSYHSISQKWHYSAVEKFYSRRTCSRPHLSLSSSRFRFSTVEKIVAWCYRSIMPIDFNRSTRSVNREREYPEEKKRERGRMSH